MASNPSPKLSPQQQHALFDILTHFETYAEIENFKNPGTIARYGPPFQDTVNRSTSPLLQTLFSKFILTLPGLRDVPEVFWQTQVAELVNDLAKAELSESYDKGVIGIRKTLATAGSALIEYPARGALGGFPRQEPVPRDKQYDTKNPKDVLQAWRDCLQAAVYEDFVDEIFAKAAQTDDLTQHLSLTQAVHEFVVVNVASMLHYTLILSPEGPSMLRLIENVHRLIPYTMVRQTLKIGNVATMISGVMKIVLAKVSISTVTNWMGLSSGADEGMNLMQQIISQVLGWEKRDLKNRATKIEKDKDSPPKAVLAELREWIASRTRTEHNEARRASKEQGRSIVMVILSLSTVSEEMTEVQHAKAQEYLALNLSVRDRDEIIRVLCKRNPDHLTAAVRIAVDAYTPMIRLAHQAVNLSESLGDLERFITDMLKVSKKGSDDRIPSVEEFVDLLHRHQQCLHKFLHQIAKNGTELTGWWRDYCISAVKQFRAGQPAHSEKSVIPDELTVGGSQEKMQQIYLNLDAKDQTLIIDELALHQKYLDDLHAASATRIGAVITRSEKTPYGPGAYLSKWQLLMDETAITPAVPAGPVRFGSNGSVKEAARKDTEGHGSPTDRQAVLTSEQHAPHAPDVKTTLALFSGPFRQALAGT